MVKIDIKLTGFPINLGEIELWFDSSFENLRKFIDLEKVANDRLKEVAKKAEHVHFPDEINDLSIKDITDETIDEAFNIRAELTAIQYDVIFGEGTFKDIYKVYPDILALDGVFKELTVAIEQQLSKELERRSGALETARKEVLGKKEQKQNEKVRRLK